MLFLQSTLWKTPSWHSLNNAFKSIDKNDDVRIDYADQLQCPYSDSDDEVLNNADNVNGFGLLV